MSVYNDSYVNDIPTIQKLFPTQEHREVNIDQLVGPRVDAETWSLPAEVALLFIHSSIKSLLRLDKTV